jgi:hypothetical protein
MRRILLKVVTFVSVAFFCGAVEAQTLGVPTETPILVISGNITNTNVSGTAQFDRPMLEALGMTKITTKSPWYDGAVVFEGVPMDRLMSVVGAKGKNVRAIALNDYVTMIPIEDFSKFGTLLAVKQNGEYMPVRDKGPLFIIYPFDSNTDLQTQTYYGRSAWQLAKLVVE